MLLPVSISVGRQRNLYAILNQEGTEQSFQFPIFIEEAGEIDNQCVQIPDYRDGNLVEKTWAEMEIKPFDAVCKLRGQDHLADV